MKIKLFAAIGCLAVTGAAATAGAQTVSSQCPPGSTNSLGVPNQQRATQDACQKAIDLYQYLAPQLGTMITGGNATLGSGSAMGGPGHFALGVRVNAIHGDLPQFNSATTPSVNGAQQSTYDLKSTWLPFPTADLSVGIFGGIPLGLTNVGALDAIVSASYMRAFNSNNVDVRVPNGSVKLGFGGRLGILQESLLVPGVSVTYLRRDLPKVDIITSNASDTLQINGLDESTKAWRVVASKSLLMFGLTVGAGQDTYNSSAAISAIVGPRTVPPTSRQTAGPIQLSQTLKRTNAFADLSLNLPLFKVIGEIGQVSGGTVTTYNKFNGNAPDASRIFGSVGIRFGF